MKGIILAAGLGSRFETRDEHKCLAKLGGLRIVERVILSFHEYSITDIIIVIGHHGSALKHYLGKGEKYGVKIQYIENNVWKQGNGTSLYAIKMALGNETHFLLSMADHWYEPKLIGDVLNAYSGTNLVCVDSTPKNSKELVGVTKVYIEDSYVKTIGKDLKRYNAVDCGVFVLSTNVFSTLEESFRLGNYSLTGGIKKLAAHKKLVAHDIGNHLWQGINTNGDLKYAEKKLFSTLRGHRDGLIAKHINRRLSIPITKIISKYDISPNVITIISFLISVGGGLSFFFGPIFILLGGVLVQLSAVIDGVDGEISRLKFKSSKYGVYLDSILDRYADAAIIIGVTYYCYRSFPETWFILVALLALLGTNLSMMSMDVFFRSFGSKYVTTTLGTKAKFLLAGRDGRLFLIFIGAITNQLLPVMIILAVTTNLLMIYRLYSVRLHKTF